jgi:hypothetical protein
MRALERMDNFIVISENTDQGNKAMASVLLLFYHLSEGGGFISSETVYIDPAVFNGFDYVDVSVTSQNRNEICEKLLREGAVIYLICELNDMISERDYECPKLSFTKDIVNLLKRKAIRIIPELAHLLRLFDDTEAGFDYKKYHSSLEIIFTKYVLATFKNLSCE